MLNASCACVSLGVLDGDTASTFTADQIFQAFNNSIDVQTGQLFDVNMTFSSYAANYCPGSRC